LLKGEYHRIKITTTTVFDHLVQYGYFDGLTLLKIKESDNPFIWQSAQNGLMHCIIQYTVSGRETFHQLSETECTYYNNSSNRIERTSRKLQATSFVFLHFNKLQP
jgi:hypothetical protein